jgi:hypothetical protein
MDFFLRTKTGKTNESNVGRSFCEKRPSVAIIRNLAACDLAPEPATKSSVCAKYIALSILKTFENQ